MSGRYEIVCETRRGFHASLGRGDPCTQYKRRCGTSSLIEVVGGRSGREFTSPVILRERRPAASRPVGEGSGAQATSAVGRHLSFLSALSSRDLSLCHPERSLRSEGSRASARACMAGAGHRSVRRDSSPQRLRMTQKKVSAGFCDAIAEPSPTGRDAAGRLSREVTGEVRIRPSCASRSVPKNLTPNPFPRGKGDNRRKKNKVGF
jgi:hypothetical protein